MRWLETLVVMYPILSAYSIGGVFSDYGTILLLIYSFIYLLITRKFTVDKSLFWFTIFCQFSYSFWVVRNGVISSSYIFNILVPFLYLIIISSIVKSINAERLIKSYHFIGIIASGVVVYQFFRLQFFGIPARPITILPIADSDLHYWGYMLGERPSGFFSEPQAFASFLFPIYIISWIQKKYFCFSIYAIALLSSMSSLGIVVCVSVIFFYLFKNISFSHSVPLLVGILIIGFLFSGGLMDESIEKLIRISVSDDIRLARGFIILSYFSFSDWLIGVGDGLLMFIINKVNEPWVKLYLLQSKHLLTYTTSFSGVIIRYGFIGILLFLILIKTLIKRLTVNRLSIMGFLMLFLSFVQTIVFNSWFLFYVLILFSVSYLKVQEK